MSSATVQLVRHATLRIAYGDVVVLVDPMLADAAAYPTVPDSPSPRNNPLGPLRIPPSDVMADASLVLVTHTHRDHWDDAAIAQVPKTLRVGCQPPDESKIAGQGFNAVFPIVDRANALGIDVVRTGGQHGTDDVGRRMGPVSGFVLKRAGLPTIYIAGDTIWCADVDAAIAMHLPDVIIVNAGAAQFNAGGPITMDGPDVMTVVQAAGSARVIAVHMECWNHCVLTRAALSESLDRAGMAGRVSIPADGEHVTL